YLAPEVLQGKLFTQAVDIYAFGVVMAEMTTGQRPFDGYKFDQNLAVKICMGLRPEFTPGTPECYIELAKQCMDPEPQKRPNVKELNLELYNLYKIINSDKSSLDDSSGTYINNQFYKVDIIINQFLDADEKIKELPIVEQRHPDHMYTSKLINAQKIIKSLSQIIGSNPVSDVEIRLCLYFISSRFLRINLHAKFFFKNFLYSC
ncbi:kinase-like domain-containing protein, partial [Gigaspora rosea]